MEKIIDLQDALFKHPDFGMALEIQNAIGLALLRRGITEQERLTADFLIDVRQLVIDQSKRPDKMMALASLVSKTANHIEASLKYLEDLIREKQQPVTA